MGIRVERRRRRRRRKEKKKASRGGLFAVFDSAILYGAEEILLDYSLGILMTCYIT
jgi:hypothetical protein